MARTKSLAQKKSLGAPTPTQASRPEHIIAECGARYPALTALQSESFEMVATDAQRTVLGKKTRAPNVLECALRWIVQIDDELGKHRAALVHYSDERFSYAIYLTGLLNAAVAKQKKGGAVVAETRTAADVARKEGVAARTALVGACDRYAGERETEQKALGDQVGVTEGDGLVTSLTNVAELAEGWLARKDPREQFLAKSAGLTADLVAQARAAAAALVPATGKVVLQGPLETRDSAETNLVEGATLMEMLYVWRIFGQAADKGGVVKRLVPNPSIAHVFTRPKAEGVPVTPAGDAPAPAAGGPKPA